MRIKDNCSVCLLRKLRRKYRENIAAQKRMRNCIYEHEFYMKQTSALLNKHLEGNSKAN